MNWLFAENQVPRGLSAKLSFCLLISNVWSRRTSRLGIRKQKRGVLDDSAIDLHLQLPAQERRDRCEHVLLVAGEVLRESLGRELFVYELVKLAVEFLAEASPNAVPSSFNLLQIM